MAPGPPPAANGRVARARSPGAPGPVPAKRRQPSRGRAPHRRTQSPEGALGADDVPGVVRSLSPGATMDVRHAGLYVGILAVVIVPLYVLDPGGWVLLIKDDERFPAMARDIILRGKLLTEAIG